jgi:glutamate 5-kinase
MVPTSGQLWLDGGAVAAVRQRGKSLFSAGIVRLVGHFGAQDCVSLCDDEGNPFAQGLCNYAHTDVIKLKVRVYLRRAIF